MGTEKLQILKMVQEGKVTPEEAQQLLAAIEEEPAKALPPKSAPLKAEAQWLRVRVSDIKTGRTKVNVNLPLGLLNVASRFIKVEHMHGVDIQEILRLIKEGARGKLVDVTDEDDGEQVEVLIE